ncbi:MAG: hypothetical protein MN733_42210, partial [Nitrososphaera sp.]|nr:hypothetical protein [Nitrososphaera sp.]
MERKMLEGCIIRHLSTREIAEEIGCSQSNVRYWLAKHGLATRPSFTDIKDDNTCDGCGRKYIYDRRKGHRQGYCNTCWQRKRRRKCTTKALEYKGGRCLICGYSRCKRALTYHH